MVVTRFDGSGPVARYWLTRCEGFKVRGGVRGRVVGLIRDESPYLTSRLVVRSRVRRRRVLRVDRVALVDPAKRTILIARRHPRPTVRIPPPRLTIPRPPLRLMRVVRAVPALVTDCCARLRMRARPLLARAAAVLRASFRRLAVEARASARLLVASLSWRRFVPSAPFASLKLPRVRSRTSSRRRTTSSRRKSARRSSRA